jgi:hypothetical protein
MLLPPAGVHRESSCKIVQKTTVPSSVEIKAFFTLLVNSNENTRCLCVNSLFWRTYLVIFHHYVDDEISPITPNGYTFAKRWI